MLDISSYVWRYMEAFVKKPNWIPAILFPFLICFQDTTTTYPGPTPSPSNLTILHTNDLHSRLNEYRTDDDRNIGGFSRIAVILEQEKAEAGGPVLTLDAGDFLMGTFFSALESSTGFQLGLMKEMGYDAVALGNHEFDFGPDHLSRIINRSMHGSEIPQLLLANIEFDPGDSLDDSLQDLFIEGVIKPYMVVEVDSIRIGLLGLMGRDAIEVSPGMRPASGLDPVRTCRRCVKHLRRNENVDVVILLSHTGLVRNEQGEWTGDDVELASKVRGIDLIIGGHSHTRLNEPVYINGIPIVQAKSYGAFVGKIILSLDQNQIHLAHYELIPVNDSRAGNQHVQVLIGRQQEMVDERILKKMGLDYESPVAETGFPLVLDEDTLLEDSNLGRFIADALYDQLNRTDTVRTDITIFPAGMIRDNISSGIQTPADLFRVVSLGMGRDDVPGYPLARIYVNARELRGILEILYIASGSNPGNHCFYGGLNVEYDPDGGFLRKVSLAEVMDESGGYIPLDFSKKNTTLYSIGANSYLLEFVSYFKKLSHGLVRVQPKHMDGKPVSDPLLTWIDADPGTPEIDEVKAWTSLIGYIRTFEDGDGDGIPEIPGKYALN